MARETTLARRRGAAVQPGRRRQGTPNGSRADARPEVSLDDKYVLEDGRILITGVQALVRLLLDQHRADRRRGLTTGTIVSGYQGSPLGGLDKELARHRELARAAPSCATCPASTRSSARPRSWGSQLAGQLPGAEHDGVLGVWYGKAPGLDRAADAIRHGNFVGVSRTGGVLARRRRRPELQVLDDPERVRVAARQPPHAGVLPRQPSRRCSTSACTPSPARARPGCGRGFKIVTNVPTRPAPPTSAPGRVAPVHARGLAAPTSTCRTATCCRPASLELERTLLGVAPRPRARVRARERPQPRSRAPRDAWLGIVAAGKAYYDLRAGAARPRPRRRRAASAPASASSSSG